MAIYSPAARDIRNNGGAVLHGGSSTANNTSFGGQPMTTKTTLLTNANVDREMQHISPRLPQSITGSSGNVGVLRGNSGAMFNPRLIPRNSVIAIGLTNQYIAGTSGIAVFSAASDSVFRPNGLINRFYGYQRLNITSWNAVTGAATYGSNRGATVLASGFNGVTGQRADDAANPTNAIPGELQFMYGSFYPSATDYGRRTG